MTECKTRTLDSIKVFRDGKIIIIMEQHPTLKDARENFKVLKAGIKVGNNLTLTYKDVS